MTLVLPVDRIGHIHKNLKDWNLWEHTGEGFLLRTTVFGFSFYFYIDKYAYIK